MEIEVLKWIVFSIMGLTIWFLKRTIDGYDKKIKSIEDELAQVRKDYLHRDDFKEFKIELRLMFEDLKQDIRALTYNEKNNLAR
jgi:hypothetical protein